MRSSRGCLTTASAALRHRTSSLGCSARMIGDEWGRGRLADTYQHLCDLRSRGTRPHLGLCGAEPSASGLALYKRPTGRCHHWQPSLAGLSLYVTRHATPLSRGEPAPQSLGGRQRSHAPRPLRVFLRLLRGTLCQTGRYAGLCPCRMRRCTANNMRVPQRSFRRRGRGVRSGRKYQQAWTFDESVQPLFPVPSCVLIGRVGAEGALPKQVTGVYRALCHSATLHQQTGGAVSYPPPLRPGLPAGSLRVGSAYREKFRQGATLVPRMLCLVEEASVGGQCWAARRMRHRARAAARAKRKSRGRACRLSASGWKSSSSGRSISANQLRPIACSNRCKALSPGKCGVGSKRLLDAAAAQQAGYPYRCRMARHCRTVSGTPTARAT